jgi:uncharacterized protein
LDSSALVKLLSEESERVALVAWLDTRLGVPRLTTELAKVEVIRACRRSNETRIPAARQLLANLDFVPLTLELLDSAATLGPPALRSLDAIHLASALSVGDELSAFVSYDRRLLAAAEEEQLPAIAPS